MRLMGILFIFIFIPNLTPVAEKCFGMVGALLYLNTYHKSIF